MRSTLFIAFVLMLVLGIPARAKHKPQQPPVARQPIATVTISQPVPLTHNPSSTKATRSFLPSTPAVKPAAVAQEKKPAAVKTDDDSVTSDTADKPVINDPLPKGALARVTAYWTNEDYYTSQHMSSTGVRLHEGHCAVDPSLIPYGSVVNIPGMGSYRAVDTGSAVVSRKAAVGAAHTTNEKNALVVDLFFENRHEAEEFAAHGPTYVSVSWKKPLTASDSPLNPRALPADGSDRAEVRVYVLENAPSLAESRLPLNFRAPTIFQ